MQGEVNMKKKLLSLTLAMALCLGLAVPALAEDWENTTDVKNYQEFTAALRDDKVAAIKIVGGVVIPETGEPIETDKPILIATDGKLTFEPGAMMHSTAGMGKFYFEDPENTWDHVPEMCESFLLWNQADGTVYRDIFGTQPEDMLACLLDNEDFLSTACLSGADVTLVNMEDEFVIDSLMVVGHNLLLGENVSMKVNTPNFQVLGDLYLNEGAKLTLEQGGYVGADVYCADPNQVPENLEVGGEVKELPAPIAFTDVAENSPFKDAIAWAVGQKITNGASATTFAPGNTCTHNHILTFLWRANGSPAAEGENDFAKAAAWAKEKGIRAAGESFDGGAACTRSQTMVYLWKLAGSPETAVNSAFTDVAADADYAQAVAWAVARGITNGTTPTTFSPDNTCTRGQIVTFLYRNLK